MAQKKRPYRPPARKQFPVLLTEEERIALDKLARKANLTASDMVRSLIREAAGT